MAVFASRQIVLPQMVNYVNFIQSSGTQYFDTGFTPNNNTSIEISYYATEDRGVVIGADKSWKSNGLTISMVAGNETAFFIVIFPDFTATSIWSLFPITATLSGSKYFPVSLLRYWLAGTMV